MAVTAIPGASGPRISVSTGALYPWPLASALRSARACGAEGVELVDGPEIWARGAVGVRRLARQAGITIHSLHPPILPFPGWLDIPSIVPRMVRLATELEVRVLCLHPPDVGARDGALADRFERALDGAAVSLRGSGVSLALENLAIYRRSELRLRWHDPANLLELARRHGLPLVFDCCHGDSWPAGLDATFEMLRERVVHVHLSDVRDLPRWLDWPRLHTYFKHHQIPGKGRLPLRRWLGDLLLSGYTGALVLEISPTALGIVPLEHVRRRLAQAIKWTEAVVGAALASAGAVAPGPARGAV